MIKDSIEHINKQEFIEEFKLSIILCSVQVNGICHIKADCFAIHSLVR
jgi:hypothetical protein